MDCQGYERDQVMIKKIYKRCTDVLSSMNIAVSNCLNIDAIHDVAEAASESSGQRYNARSLDHRTLP